MNLYNVYFTDGSRGEVNASSDGHAIATAQARYNKAVSRVSFVRKVQSAPAVQSDFEFLHSINPMNG